jgi:alkylhydroperoxidase family enzyme
MTDKDASATRIMALDLAPAAPRSPATQAYFDKCVEKLGMVPNVLLAYAFDEKKLRAFSDMYNDLMLADSGLSKR